MTAKADSFFKHPLNVLEEARECLDAFNVKLANFTKHNEARFVVDRDANGCETHKVVFPPEVPDSVHRKAYAVATHVRNALDQACYQSTLAITRNKKLLNTYFPSAENPTDLNSVFDPKAGKKGGRSSDIPADIQAVLRGFEPYWSDPKKTYPGGDDLLRTLLKVSGPNKHQLGLVVDFNPNAFRISNLSHGLGIQELVVGPRRIGNTNEYMFLRCFPPRNGKTEYDAGVSYFVSITQTDSLRHTPADWVLTKWVEKATSIVEQLRDATEPLIS